MTGDEYRQRVEVLDAGEQEQSLRETARPPRFPIAALRMA
jgi:hypothetical protein